MKNLTCLADGYVFPTDLEVTGINANEIIVGPTRCGKTAVPRFTAYIRNTKAEKEPSIPAFNFSFISGTKKSHNKINAINTNAPQETIKEGFQRRLLC